MKKLADPLFIGYCLLWCVVHYLRWIHQPLPWLNSYLTDFLFVPAMAHIALYLTRLLLNAPSYRYPVSYLLFMAGYTAIIFEYTLPLFSPAYTRDYGDVAAYFAGGLFYYYVHQGRYL